MFESELFVKHIESNLINKTVSYQQIKTTYPKIKNENLLREQIVKWNNFLKSDLHKFSLDVLSNKIEVQKEIMMYNSLNILLYAPKQMFSDPNIMKELFYLNDSINIFKDEDLCLSGSIKSFITFNSQMI
jgi:hypothetical protein